MSTRVVWKFNPHHDDQGQFSSGPGGGAAAKPAPKSGKAAHDSLMQQMEDGKVATKLSGYEPISVQTYAGGGYERINAYARSGGADTKASYDTKRQVAGLDKAIARGKITEDVTVYRGLSGGLGGGQNLVGRTIQDKGFVSTTTDKGIAGRFASGGKDTGRGTILEIRVPRGANALYLPGAIRPGLQSEGVKAERELLLPRNSKFRITGYEQRGNRSVYQAEVVA